MANVDATKVALVTGGSSGIGEAITKSLLEKGYKVAFCGRRREKVERVSQEYAQHGPLGLVLDLSEPDNSKVAVQKTIEHFGRLDVLVNNAGIFAKTLGDDAESYEAYRHLMSINLDASVRATLAAVDELKRTKGHIIFISSTAAAKAHASGYAYCVSKSAMTMFAQCLAIDLAEQVRVNIVSPGPVASEIFESVGLSKELARVAMAGSTLDNRTGETREIADVVMFLLSSGGSFILGQQIFVDGGYLLKPSSSSANRQVQAAREAKKD